MQVDGACLDGNQSLASLPLLLEYRFAGGVEAFGWLADGD